MGISSSAAPKGAPSIVYEDERLIVAYKPPGMLSHKDRKLASEPDLLSEMARRFPRLESADLQISTRLDFNTDGLVLLAKGKANAEVAGKAVARGLIRKFYHAVVLGYMPKPTDILIGYLLKDSESATVKISTLPIEGAMKIQTAYRVLREENGMSLLDIELLTGKTHQIRAHLASLNHALVGDPLYGFHNLNKKQNLKRQALSAVRLQFDVQAASHPWHDLNGRIFEKLNPELNAILQQKR
jgi:23S rRNA pseudouridine955/2504/2580 synthase